MTIQGDVSNLVKWGENELHIVEVWVGKEVKEGEAFISKEAAIGWTDLQAFFKVVKADTYAQVKPFVEEVIATGEKDLATLEAAVLNVIEEKAAALFPIVREMESAAIQAIIAFVMATVARIP